MIVPDDNVLELPLVLIHARLLIHSLYASLYPLVQQARKELPLLANRLVGCCVPCSAADKRLDRADDESGEWANLEINLDGRRCSGYDFSKTAPHSCCIYDKTREIVTSRKDCMVLVWESNGWDGSSRVIRVEFRYERECLKELGIEDPYTMLDQLPGLWAYSTQQWLRHTIPTHDKNRGRWETSPFWLAIQQAAFFCNGEPAVRERKHKGDLTHICQMLCGCSTTAAAYLAQVLPEWDAGANFLSWFMSWFMTWQDEYLKEK